MLFLDGLLNVTLYKNMKKLLLIFALAILHFAPCNAQDTLALKNGKKIIGTVISVGKQKVTYMVLPDSTPKAIASWRMDYIAYPGGTKFNFTDIQKPSLPSKTEFYLSFDAGFSVPAISYRDGIVGTHFGIRPTYYVSDHVGLTARVQTDLNGTGLMYTNSTYFGGFYVFQQYLAGISYRIGGKPGFPWVDFVGLCGFCTAANPVYEQGGGINPLTVTSPGNGTGVGYYAGVDFRSSADHFVSITFGAGCLGAVFSYPDYSSTVSTYNGRTQTTTNTVSDGATKMSLALFQMYFGINFRLKKSGR